ncbi:bile acid:sodium symporter [Leeia sp. TBRC 13508]|uniref:Bile acid:sodium symporter n=1 Tax=Leeia speluncae TaxID=2884804 RepID=A0ABS8D1N1_9NEIS|nr:bile acid:sodium symporter family protein [Leeia speluncae]MCB6182108.1 bile acid:sodium symporter [Leeia speluncae]
MPIFDTTRFKWPFDGFISSMLGAILLALFIPSVGASHGPLHLDIVTAWGVALVFFLNGALLPTEKLKAGFKNYRLHLLVQSSTYILFPILGLLIGFLLKNWLDTSLVLGIVYLCALSSTVSSSVTMTTIAKGNVTGAIFNATLSTLLGMLLTPLLVSFYASKGAAGSFSFANAIIAIAIQLLLPFIVGHLLRKWLLPFLKKGMKVVNKVDKTVIVLIVFNAFCDSTLSGLWHQQGISLLIQALVVAAILLLLVLTITAKLSRVMGFSLEDEIAAVFCGSKKSVANGVPMAKMLFGSSVPLGPIVLPIMIYHQLQLIICAILARKYAQKVELLNSLEKS